LTDPSTRPLRIDVFTIFPEAIEQYCSVSVLGRARELGVVDIRVHDLRDGAEDARRSIDDAPFGGGAGMVLMSDPVFRAVETVEADEGIERPLILMSPGGPRFDQQTAVSLAAGNGFSLLCGRYEGVDQRIADHLVDAELSLGDFVLAGGELAALSVIESVARLRSGVLGNETSAGDESFTDGLLEYPQYTRPSSFREWEVPEILRSGDHQAVERWRRVQAIKRTLERRPDLIEARGGLSPGEVELLVEHGEVQVLADHGYDCEPGKPLQA
jgi:tRNA (guanine37-N1)-methyltransferase